MLSTRVSYVAAFHTHKGEKGGSLREGGAPMHCRQPRPFYCHSACREDSEKAQHEAVEAMVMLPTRVRYVAAFHTHKGEIMGAGVQLDPEKFFS